MSRVTAIAASVIILLIVSLAWGVNHYRDNALKYKGQRDHATSALTLANNVISDMQVRQRDVAALDAKYTGELADAKAENDALKRKLDNGGRMLVKGKCPVPATTGTASPDSVGDDATVELSPTAGRNILDIRAGIVSDQQKIRYLQEYIRRIRDEND